MLIDDHTLERLCRARDLLCDVDGSRLRVAEIAARAGISPYHFIRQFRAVFGTTPHQMRIRARLDHARRLLAVGDHSVTEVCMEVGFSSLGSFSALFSRRLGLSPSAYRWRVRPMVQVPGIMPARLIPGCLSLMASLPPDAFRNFGEASNRRLGA